MKVKRENKGTGESTKERKKRFTWWGLLYVQLAFVKGQAAKAVMAQAPNPCEQKLHRTKRRVLHQVNGILGGLRMKARGYRHGRLSDVPCGRQSACRLLCERACHCRLGAQRRALLLEAYRSRRSGSPQVNKNK